MFKKIIFTILFLIISSEASDVLVYKSDNSTSLSNLLSYKEAKLHDNLYLSLDLSHILTLIDDRFVTDVNPISKHINPDKSVITLSYTF